MSTFVWNWQIKVRSNRDEKIKSKERHLAAQAVRESLIPDGNAIPNISLRPFIRPQKLLEMIGTGSMNLTPGSHLPFIGDVTGHGFSSALVTAAVAGCVKAILSETTDLHILAVKSELASKTGKPGGP